MHRIRWYGPTLTLLVTSLLVMVLGPTMARHITWAQTDAQIQLARTNLETDPSLAKLSDAFREVARAVEPSVVHVQVFSRDRRPENPLRRFFGPHGPQMPDPREDEDFEDYDVPQLRGNGSGWVYDKEGHIVTNNHVIQNADEIKCRFHDGSERTATVVGRDPKTDIAVLKVSGDSLHPAAIAREPVQKGDIVFAFGSPFRFEFTVSQGIVSGMGRQLQIIERGYENFIQTDAAINPGNSGGPLTNIQAQVVGMNTAIASRTGTYTGLGFAIPARMVQSIVDQILETGGVQRGYLGVYIEELTPRMAKTFTYEGEGVLITGAIEGSPAEEAELKRGDIITEVNGEPVSEVNRLRRLIAAHQPGTSVTLTIFRQGRTLEVPVTLAELPETPSQARGPAGETEPEAPARQLLRKLGFERLRDLTPEIARQLELEALDGGVVVQSVRRGSVAASEGIVPRSIITHVMGEPVESVAAFAEKLAAHDLTEAPVRVSLVIRDPRSGETVSRFALLELDE